MGKILILILLLLVVYPLVTSASDWKVVPHRNEMIGDALIIENPNK